MRKLTLKEFQERLNEIHPKEKLGVLNYNGGREKCDVICLTCGTIYNKTGENFLSKTTKSICKQCFPTQPNTLKEYKLPEEYEYMEDYKGMYNKVLVRHKKCGFIWKITPNNIKLGKGCPKCNKKISKGEQKIIKWCEENNIKFETQVPLKMEGHNLVLDFYLPKYDLYIEYNGEQHYHPVEYFGGEEKFKKQIELDKIKVNFLKNKLLVISYLDFENIESILYNSTTIPNGSTPKQVEAKNI